MGGRSVIFMTGTDIAGDEDIAGDGDQAAMNFFNQH